MKYTQSIGNVNELKCLIGFIELGYDCSIPYGNNSKYDFIADINGNLLKIQCKSSSYARRNGIVDKNAFWIDTTSGCSNTHETVRHTYNKEDVDYFATCWDNKIYLIPVEECNTSKTLRLAPPKTKIPYFSASDYELEKILGKNSIFVQSKEDYLSRFDRKSETTNKNLKSKEKVQHFCKKCNKEITTNSDYCVECAHTLSRKVERPDRNTLKELIRTKPFTKIGEMYNVSDNSIRKWCKSYNLPFNKIDIFAVSESDWELI